MSVSKMKLDIPNANIVSINTAKLIAKSIVIDNGLYPKDNSVFSATILIQISNCFRVSALLKELIAEMESTYSPDYKMNFILINTDAIYYGNSDSLEKIELAKYDYFDIVKLVEDNKERFKNIFVNLVDMDLSIVQEITKAMNFLIANHRANLINMTFIADSFGLSRVREAKNSSSLKKILKASDKVIEVNDYSFIS